VPVTAGVPLGDTVGEALREADTEGEGVDDQPHM